MHNRFILTPWYLDQPLPGLKRLRGPGWVVNEPALPEGTAQARMAALYDPLADWVAGCVRQGDRPVSVAGDCCTSLGALAGLQRAGLAPALIWFDAHGDFNTWETTPSGFLGGMPLAMLVGHGEQSVVDALGLQPLPEERVILAGSRDLDPGEREALAGSRVTLLPDVSGLLERELPTGPLWVHFDTDVVDPDESPAMNYPTPGGPTAEILGQVLRCLARTGQVVAVSLSSWNPDLDVEGNSQRISMGLLDQLIADLTD
jgi:arginase